MCLNLFLANLTENVECFQNQTFLFIRIDSNIQFKTIPKFVRNVMKKEMYL